MGNASNAQTEFLSGEWSTYAQGRLDDPEYKRGMNVCRNVIPIETGAATRRVGTRFLDFTRDGQKGLMIAFSFSQNAPYTMEFTDGFLRFRDSKGLVRAEEPRQVQYISTATPAQLVVANPCAGIAAWVAGNEIIFNFPVPGASVASGALVGRQFKLYAGSDANHWFLYDAVTGLPLDGSTVEWNDELTIQVARIFELATPYNNGAWAALRGVQSEDSVLLLHPSIQPQTIFTPIDGGNLFTITPSQFIDGPYLDPPTDGSYVTIDGQSGLVDFVITYPAWDATLTYPNGNRFAAGSQVRAGTNSTITQGANGSVVNESGTLYLSIKDGNINHSPPNATWWTPYTAPTLSALDIGRSVRLFSAPANWLVVTAYNIGDLVTYQGAYYTAIVANTGNIPGADAVNWGVASNAAEWTWAIITAVGGAFSFTAAIQGDPILYNQPLTLYRLGVWANSTSWPACGTFHEGRFWLAGAVKNRFDASTAAGDEYDFTPTAPDGTVSDANAISYTLLSPQQNQLIWMIPDHQGIVAGTAQGEWLIQSSNNNDPITPTSIQAHNGTKLGSSNVEPRRTGLTIAFVQRFGRKAIDYVCDLFSSKFSGLNLSARAKHLTGQGIVRLAYQQELVPVIWALTGDNKLIGTTYKRESLMVSQPPTFNGWHRHDLGSGYNVIDLVEGPSPNGLLDTVTLMTQDPATGICQVEAITELFDETSTLPQAWFVDKGIVPCGGSVTSLGVTLSGLAPLNGQLVSAFLAGLDCGDYTPANGQVFVPFQSDPDKAFTLVALQAANAANFQYGFDLSYDNIVTQQTMLQFPPLSNTILSGFTYLDYGSQAITDWLNDRVTFMLPGTAPSCGLVQYRISSGALIKYATIDDIFGVNDPPFYDPTIAYTGNPLVVGSDNRIYAAIVSNSFGVNPAGDNSTDWDAVFYPFEISTGYNSGTTYGTGALVVSAGAIYQSLQNSNTGHTPATSPTWWQLFFAVPPTWNATTTYGAATLVTDGSSSHIFYPLQNVTAGFGAPSTFSNNNNAYWGTGGNVFDYNITTAGLGLDYNGDIYMYTGNGLTPYVKIDGNTLQMKGNFSVPAGQSLPAPANGVIPLRILDNNFNAMEDYILETVNTTPSGSTEPSAVLISVNGLIASEEATFTFDEGTDPIACSGVPAVGIGNCFVLTRISGGTAIALGLYEIDAQSQLPIPPMQQLGGGKFWKDPNTNIYGNAHPQGSSMRKAGVINPSDIDPLWTFWNGQVGLMYDALDGNVMTFVSTTNPSNYNSGTSYAINDLAASGYAVGSDGNVYKAKATGTLPDPTGDAGVHWTLIGAKAVQLCYLVKFTTDCARTLWRVPVAAPPSTDLSLQFTNISNGGYSFEEDLGSGSFQGRTINTLTGESTTFTTAGFPQLGAAQVYNDKTGAIVIYPQYDSTVSGAPVPVGPQTGTSWTGWGVWTVPPATFSYQTTGVVGYTYTSQGQLLRPVAPQATGARNGPAFGKNRRNHRYAMSVANTQGISVGTTFNNLHKAIFKTLGGTAYPQSQLYSGEFSNTVEDTYGYDGMLCWQVTRPLPATMTAFGGFLETEDR